MAKATLTISSKNYSSWSLRGWLLCRMAALDFDEELVATDDQEIRQELLLLSPSVRVPRLTDGEVTVWDTLAIAEYLAEIAPEAGIPVIQQMLKPEDLYSADEVFISSTNRNLLGVGEIVGHAIANAPGPVTRQLDELFDSHVADYVTRRLAAGAR